MPFAVHNGTVICWLCHRAEHDTPPRTPAPGIHRRPARAAGDLKGPAGWKPDYSCHDCRAIHPRCIYGRCERCALAAVFDHLVPAPEARRVLAPLREALLTGPRPASSLSWLRTNPGLLVALGTGALPVDHAALDALPRSRTTETIHGQLVATGYLPARNTYAADFQRWLTDHLAEMDSVAAACGADALTAAGWDGPTNYDNDTAKFSAVVSAWERRFGARVVAVGFGTLHLSVAAPPADTQEALQVAAEHFAFCPDNIWQGPRPCTLAAYAERIVGMNSWDFW